ncbi:MAG: hypothetical protein B6D44_11855 [Ignavibacteriales bacterium UTCHB2]|jgi:hypothetical protein|nr:MAG: hypothetical protein BWY38_02508 [Ignavibacteria bacterium ADurb.Bin266]OQY71779.1 MAG: hypothetical protein B6D44_11855 [Ignavibacteriales bacterium UTCHB2]HQI42376.1 T9SS type A sorting domain-containing protein [Ignavibacteriaceae bacterium]
MKCSGIFNVLILVISSYSFINAQAVNPERGDGFWSLVNPIRLNQIIWMNDTLYAARNPLYQSNGGIYRSIDGGLNWDTLYSLTYSQSPGVRLFIHPTDHKILYMIAGNLYKSTNSGQSWQTIFGAFGPLLRLGINPKNPNIMYVTKSIPYGQVFKTTDGGLNWSDASVGLPIGEYFQAGPIEVNPEFPDTILLGTNFGLYRSTNGAASWDSTAVKGFITGVNINPYLTNDALASTLDGYNTYRTENFGSVWELTNYTSASSKFVFNAIDNNVIYCNTNRKSYDRGKNWLIIDTVHNSWTDLTINNLNIPTLYGLNLTYGLFEYTDNISSVEIEKRIQTIKKFISYPNPFNNTTTINCKLNQSSQLTIYIYNSLGQRIKTLVNKAELSAGEHNYLWNGQDDYKSNVASGIYFCMIFTESDKQKDVQTLKLLLLK